VSSAGLNQTLSLICQPVSFDNEMEVSTNVCHPEIGVQIIWHKSLSGSNEFSYSPAVKSRSRISCLNTCLQCHSGLCGIPDL